MSWLLFLDESGHDHRTMPYEVHGGIALHASQLWGFVRDIQRIQQEVFGGLLAEFGQEMKGSHLLDKDRFKWASQGHHFSGEERRKHCRAFFSKGAAGRAPKREEFTAYGQACLLMASSVFQSLCDHDAVLFASAIPKSTMKPATPQAQEFLRKDLVFLLERFFYFLESKKEQGLLVMDQSERTAERSLVKKIEKYFRETQSGRYRTKWIVPVPMFVASDLAFPIQAADLCIYCLNWGFRLPSRGMDATTRPEIQEEFFSWLERLQYQGEGYREGQVFPTFGIIFISDPYTGKKKEAKSWLPPAGSPQAEPPNLK